MQLQHITNSWQEKHAIIKVSGSRARGAHEVRGIGFGGGAGGGEGNSAYPEARSP